MLVQLLAVIVCPSVHTSHASIMSKRLNEELHKQRHMIAQGLQREQWLVGDAPVTLKYALKVNHPPPYRTGRFRRISVHSASTVTAGEKKFN